MKLCTDCKYYGPDFKECLRKDNVINVVTGDVGKEIRWPWCNIQREDGFFLMYVLGTCGKQGRFWEAKK